MQFVALPLAGAFRIHLEHIADNRGFFARTFCADEFRSHGLVTQFVQHSVSFNARKGTLRGLHYQADPYAETKLVRCTAGAVFDVLVDLRRSSPTFGRWHAEMLTADNHVILYVPPGCAHGFQTLEDGSELYYEIAPAYVPSAARGLAFNDPALGIAWPLPNPIMSVADQSRPPLAAAETFA
jgi:dTDP-4-dehydrorhamnose 3,5-epimerase